MINRIFVKKVFKNISITALLFFFYLFVSTSLFLIIFSQSKSLLTYAALLIIGFSATIVIILFSIKFKVLKLNKRIEITKRNLVFLALSVISSRGIVFFWNFIYQKFETNSLTYNDQVLNSVFSEINPFVYIMIFLILFSIIEELLFRGFIIGLICKTRPILGTIISSVLFGLFHNTNNLSEFALYSLIGFFFSVLYVITKDVRYSIIGHILHNLLSVF